MQNSSLREAALWYPTVPELGLCLNEASFTGENPSSTGYQPLFWIHFGGPSGSYLEHITGVSVFRPRGLYSLEFHYEPNCGPAGVYKLGRRKAEDVSHIQEFVIDGAGGEFIESIEVSLQRSERERAYSFCKHGILKSVKVSYSFSLEKYVVLSVGATDFLLPWCVIDYDKSQTFLPCRYFIRYFFSKTYRDCSRNYPYRSLCKSGRYRSSCIEDESC